MQYVPLIYYPGFVHNVHNENCRGFQTHGGPPIRNYIYITFSKKLEFVLIC